MSYQVWVQTLEPVLAQLLDATQALTRAVRADTGHAWYRLPAPEGEEAEVVSGAAARAAIAEHIQHLNYPCDSEDMPALGVGYAQASSDTLDLAGTLNVVKERWKKEHKAVRDAATAELKKSSARDGMDAEEAAGTDGLRRVLALLGHPGLNLDATDRKIPILPGPPLSLHWQHYVARASQRRTLDSVLAALEKVASDTGDKRASQAACELDVLRGHDPQTPVAYRAKPAEISIRYSGTCLVGDQRKHVTNYGVNPVLAPAAAFVPKLTAFERLRKPGAGQPATISDRQVSQVLPHYFWYEEAAASPAAVPVRDEQNPYASTPWPGLWLATRKRKQALGVVVMVKRLDGSQFEVAVGRRSLAESWVKAAEVYALDRGIALDAVIGTTPTQHQIAQLVSWAAQRRGFS